MNLGAFITTIFFTVATKGIYDWLLMMTFV